MREDQTAALEAAIAQCVIELPDVQFVFIPMSQHPFVHAHNDLLLARSLRGRVPGLAVLEGSLRPEEAMAVFGRLSAAVCMRYHSLLFAARAGTPIIAVPYAPKCEAWIEEHGLQGVPIEPTALASAIRAAVGVGRQMKVA